MTTLTAFEEKWIEGHVIDLPEPDPLLDHCKYARPYAEWCEALLDDVKVNRGEISVNLALLQLQRQYWSRYETAPKSHRNHIGMRSKHKCLFQVYRHYYEQLHELHLDVNPPQLREVPPPYVPAPTQIAGVAFGIIEDDAEDD